MTLTVSDRVGYHTSAKATVVTVACLLSVSSAIDLHVEHAPTDPSLFHVRLARNNTGRGQRRENCNELFIETSQKSGSCAELLRRGRCSCLAEDRWRPLGCRELNRCSSTRGALCPLKEQRNTMNRERLPADCGAAYTRTPAALSTYHFRATSVSTVF